MATVIAFLIGVVVGGGVMFFVYRNNKKKLEELEEKAKAVKDTIKG